ncbi:alpha/beta fold hydrolase [Candidatus Uhrbacteria bacterium]|nr:alpha/beta fold hydrolase [Candidatus Uhrbacteria bacterium]
MHVDLQQIVTRDGIVLSGGVVFPTRKGKTAMILIHGLGGSFVSWFFRVEPLLRLCARRGVAVGSFANRGSGRVSALVTEQFKKRRVFGGATFERFADCIHDIRAAIDFFARHGYRRIVLVGHSTGANKAVYYLWKTRDRRVKHLVLLGPLSDVVGEMQLRGRRLTGLLQKARAQVQRGRGDELFTPVLPSYLWSADRYLSLFTHGSSEDVFPYSVRRGNWRAVASIRAPLTVILGSNDQYLDRDASDVVQAFQEHATHTRQFRGIIIPEADHSFNGKEKELARALITTGDP